MRMRTAIVVGLVVLAAGLAGAALAAAPSDPVSSSPGSAGGKPPGHLVLHHGGMTILWPIRGQRTIAIGRWQRQAVIRVRQNCFAPQPSGGSTSATLRLDRASAHPGDTVVATLTDTGTTCLVTGLAYGWERERAGGGWEPVPPPPDLFFPDIGLYVAPGALRLEEEQVWEQMTPGTYRLVKDVSGTGGAPDGGPLALTLASGPLVVTVP